MEVITLCAVSGTVESIIMTITVQVLPIPVTVTVAAAFLLVSCLVAVLPPPPHYNCHTPRHYSADHCSKHMTHTVTVMTTR